MPFLIVHPCPAKRRSFNYATPQFHEKYKGNSEVCPKKCPNNLAPSGQRIGGPSIVHQQTLRSSVVLANPSPLIRPSPRSGPPPARPTRRASIGGVLPRAFLEAKSTPPPGGGCQPSQQLGASQQLFFQFPDPPFSPPTFLWGEGFISGRWGERGGGCQPAAFFQPAAFLAAGGWTPSPPGRFERPWSCPI